MSPSMNKIGDFCIYICDRIFRLMTQVFFKKNKEHQFVYFGIILFYSSRLLTLHCRLPDIRVYT